MLERERIELKLEIGQEENNPASPLAVLKNQDANSDQAERDKNLHSPSTNGLEPTVSSKENSDKPSEEGISAGEPSLAASKKSPAASSNDKKDLVGQILASSQQPPSLVTASLLCVLTLLICSLAHLGTFGKFPAELLCEFSVAGYFLYVCAKFHAAALIKDDGPYLSPALLLIAVSAMFVLSFENYASGMPFVTAISSLLAMIAFGASSVVQCFYLKRFMSAFAPQLSLKNQNLISGALFATSCLVMGEYPKYFFLVQYLLVCLQIHLMRTSAGAESAAAAEEKTHSSQILLPYHSSQIGRMVANRLITLKNSPSLMAAGLACCVALWLSINWLFDHYLSQSSDPAVIAQLEPLRPPSLITNQSNNGFESSQIIVGSLIVLCLAAIVYMIRASLSTPKYILISPLGIRLIYTGLWFRRGEVLKWDSLKGIHISDASIYFAATSGEGIRLKLNCIGNTIDRKLLLGAIKNWGRLVPRDAEVEEILEVPSNHSYTELWLQSLTAPPKRERLKPLISGALLQEGAFEVIRALGSGGQGFAYLVWDTINHQEAVLKEFILPTYVSSVVRMRALEAFENEARMLKSLDHKQIVRLRDYFVEDHRAYLVLDYLKGTTLKDLVGQRGRLDEPSALILAKKMCEILVYLHGLLPPVIHRDFTPDNLIYDENGTLTLIDFNVAQEEQESTTGNIVGKHAYVPPEQFQGQARTGSDIYALGATLYYLVAGVDPQPITTSIISEVIPTSSPDLDHIVQKATALDSSQRYQTASDLLREIDALIDARQVDQQSIFFATQQGAQPRHQIRMEQTSIENKPMIREKSDLAKPALSAPVGTKTVHSRNNNSKYALSTCALVLLVAFSLTWIHSWPFQEFLVADTKDLHTLKDFQDKLEQAHEAWWRLRFKLSDDLAGHSVNEFKNKTYIAKRNYSKLYEQQATAVFWEKDYPRAIQLADQALALEPTRTAYNIKGAAYFLQNDFDDALKNFNQAITLKRDRSNTQDLHLELWNDFDTNWYALSMRAKIALRLGNAKQSLSDFAFLVKLKELEPSEILTMGLAREFEKDLLGASERLKTFVEKVKQPGSEDCRLAESELERLSSYRAAVEVSDGQSKSLQSDEFWQVRRAVIQKQYKRVYELCQKHLEKLPDEPNYLIDMANALAALGNTKKAIEVLEHVNQISPHNEEVEWALAELYYKLDEYPRAFALFDSLSKNAPRSKYFLRLGEIARKQEKFSLALSFDDKAIALDPKRNRPHSERCAVLVALGRAGEAANELHARSYETYQADEFAAALVRLNAARAALKQAAEIQWNDQILKDMGPRDPDKD